ncbi:TPA: dihydrodipicolinate reductase [Citrobacter farmeri]|uniref:Dihydrodipicolinate reductase n=1 Tax=Citrobacter farmeri TaxID=67824 RepID=A0A8H9TTH4_9ENTR|nr:dihydrodipicolinate reductase [Citrobacter farmeri]NTY15639.1 dihydrodipicolinate reductase [Citrobacter farmeri]HAT1583723.1 dihydrodipicolinate reductase [Citrobacter farmeri]HCB1455852.1 dihydrodipicolinate reductase [Citrobacter farmeri]HCB1606591.1 dihydrodipicolinate reductase [Citrobacter farmeri]
MKKRRPRIVQFGCGRMSAYLMRYALAGGAEIVAAFDRNAKNIGVDIGEKTGAGMHGITIQHPDKAAEFFRDNAVDVCIVATRSLLREVEDVMALCVEHGINVLTLCDEALFPWNSSPALTEKLDRAAKQKGVTIMGSGYPDLCYCHFVTTVAGSSHKIAVIRGQSSYNADDYGIALAEHHGVGLSPEEFERQITLADSVSDAERATQIATGTFTPVPMWNANGWLCSRLGLTVTRQTQQSLPVFHDQPVFSRTLGRTIPEGHAIGMTSRVITETREGIRVETEGIGKVYLPGEVDTNAWTIEGEPNTRFSIDRPMNQEMICALLVNRIPDVITAAPGFVTTDRLGPAQTHPHGLWVDTN